MIDTVFEGIVFHITVPAGVSKVLDVSPGQNIAFARGGINATI